MPLSKSIREPEKLIRDRIPERARERGDESIRYRLEKLFRMKSFYDLKLLEETDEIYAFDIN